MQRFYLDHKQCQESILTLTGPEAHHASVLHVRKGETVTVLDGVGHTIECEVQNLDRKTVSLRVIKKAFTPPSACQITLFQAVPKGKIIDSIIQKATELGVNRIVPLLCERVTTQLDEAGAQNKAEKWQTVALEAIKQCGQPWLPKVEAPVKPAEFLARKEKFDLALVGSLQGDGQHPRKYFASLKQALASVSLWVGPEGDFTPGELDTIRASGAKPITMGHLILRVETAATYGLSIINYEIQSLIAGH